MQIHLIRHGEVDNPGDAVYADIPGFGLTERGRAQATSAGEHLSRYGVSLIVSSPLDRAVETSRRISDVTRIEVTLDERLTEWGLAVRWRGATWRRLPVVFPGELESYITDPFRLSFCDESLHQVARRIGAAVAEWSDRHGNVAFVSHEDPLHATILHLTGTKPEKFHENKPGHCSVTTLSRAHGAWEALSRWNPPAQQE